jgi:phenylpyruvate tautomerase PptA (4-oxalocrotonate tautomerase family)
VLTGASFNLWDPDFGEPYAWAEPDVVIDALFKKRKNQARNKRTAFFGLPDSVVNDPGTLPCTQPRIVYRDVGRATDSRTVIACLAPQNIVLTNAAPYLYAAEPSPQLEAAMLGVLSSRVLDWYARLFVEIHLNTHILNAIPFPCWSESSSTWARVVQLAGSLAACDERFATWAHAIGVIAGSKSDAEKDDVIAELDALVAHLYGLTREHVEVVFSTFQRGMDYAPLLAAVLEHYDSWADRANAKANA